VKTSQVHGKVLAIHREKILWLYRDADRCVQLMNREEAIGYMENHDADCGAILPEENRIITGYRSTLTVWWEGAKYPTTLPNGEHVSAMHGSKYAVVIGTASGKMARFDFQTGEVKFVGRVSEKAIVKIEEIGLYLYLVTDEDQSTWTCSLV
jgi:hypothetical protein